MFSWIFDAVVVHRGELELVKVALQTGLPVVFVPLYRSHLDPFLISWTLLNFGFRPPLFLASHSLLRVPILRQVTKMNVTTQKYCWGVNRNSRIHSFIQWLLVNRIAAKLIGGIGYVGKRDGGEKFDYASPEISAATYVYFSLLLKKGNSIMLPVEPHRSRTGKPSNCVIGGYSLRYIPSSFTFCPSMSPPAFI
jgi:hypothetical protein